MKPSGPQSVSDHLYRLDKTRKDLTLKRETVLDLLAHLDHEFSELDAEYHHQQHEGGSERQHRRVPLEIWNQLAAEYDVYRRRLVLAAEFLDEKLKMVSQIRTRFQLEYPLVVGDLIKRKGLTSCDTGDEESHAVLRQKEIAGSRLMARLKSLTVSVESMMTSDVNQQRLGEFFQRLRVAVDPERAQVGVYTALLSVSPRREQQAKDERARRALSVSKERLLNRVKHLKASKKLPSSQSDNSDDSSLSGPGLPAGDASVIIQEVQGKVTSLEAKMKGSVENLKTDIDCRSLTTTNKAEIANAASAKTEGVIQVPEISSSVHAVRDSAPKPGQDSYSQGDSSLADSHSSSLLTLSTVSATLGDSLQNSITSADEGKEMAAPPTAGSSALDVAGKRPPSQLSAHGNRLGSKGSSRYIQIGLPDKPQQVADEEFSCTDMFSRRYPRYNGRTGFQEPRRPYWSSSGNPQPRNGPIHRGQSQYQHLQKSAGRLPQLAEDGIPGRNLNVGDGRSSQQSYQCQWTQTPLTKGYQSYPFDNRQVPSGGYVRTNQPLSKDQHWRQPLQNLAQLREGKEAGRHVLDHAELVERLREQAGLVSKLRGKNLEVNEKYLASAPPAGTHAREDARCTLVRSAAASSSGVSSMASSESSQGESCAGETPEDRLRDFAQLSGAAKTYWQNGSICVRLVHSFNVQQHRGPGLVDVDTESDSFEFGKDKTLEELSDFIHKRLKVFGGGRLRLWLFEQDPDGLFLPRRLLRGQFAHTHLRDLNRGVVTLYVQVADPKECSFAFDHGNMRFVFVKTPSLDTGEFVVKGHHHVDVSKATRAVIHALKKKFLPECQSPLKLYVEAGGRRMYWVPHTPTSTLNEDTGGKSRNGDVLVLLEAFVNQDLLQSGDSSSGVFNRSEVDSSQRSATTEACTESYDSTYPDLDTLSQYDATNLTDVSNDGGLSKVSDRDAGDSGLLDLQPMSVEKTDRGRADRFSHADVVTGIGNGDKPKALTQTALGQTNQFIIPFDGTTSTSDESLPSPNGSGAVQRPPLANKRYPQWDLTSHYLARFHAQPEGRGQPEVKDQGHEVIREEEEKEKKEVVDAVVAGAGADRRQSCGPKAQALSQTGLAEKKGEEEDGIPRCAARDAGAVTYFKNTSAPADQLVVSDSDRPSAATLDKAKKAVEEVEDTFEMKLKQAEHALRTADQIDKAIIRRSGQADWKSAPATFTSRFLHQMRDLDSERPRFPGGKENTSVQDREMADERNGTVLSGGKGMAETADPEKNNDQISPKTPHSAFSDSSVFLSDEGEVNESSSVYFTPRPNFVSLVRARDMRATGGNNLSYLHSNISNNASSSMSNHCNVPLQSTALALTDMNCSEDLLYHLHQMQTNPEGISAITDRSSSFMAIRQSPRAKVQDGRPVRMEQLSAIPNLSSSFMEIPPQHQLQHGDLQHSRSFSLFECRPTAPEGYQQDQPKVAGTLRTQTVSEANIMKREDPAIMDVGDGLGLAQRTGLNADAIEFVPRTSEPGQLERENPVSKGQAAAEYRGQKMRDIRPVNPPYPLNTASLQARGRASQQDQPLARVLPRQELSRRDGRCLPSSSAPAARLPLGPAYPPRYMAEDLSSSEVEDAMVISLENGELPSCFQSKSRPFEGVRHVTFADQAAALKGVVHSGWAAAGKKETGPKTFGGSVRMAYYHQQRLEQVRQCSQHVQPSRRRIGSGRFPDTPHRSGPLVPATRGSADSFPPGAWPQSHNPRAVSGPVQLSRQEPCLPEDLRRRLAAQTARLGGRFYMGSRSDLPPLPDGHRPRASARLEQAAFYRNIPPPLPQQVAATGHGSVDPCQNPQWVEGGYYLPEALQSHSGVPLYTCRETNDHLGYREQDHFQNGYGHESPPRGYGGQIYPASRPWSGGVREADVRRVPMPSVPAEPHRYSAAFRTPDISSSDQSDCSFSERRFVGAQRLRRFTRSAVKARDQGLENFSQPAASTFHSRTGSAETVEREPSTVRTSGSTRTATSSTSSSSSTASGGSQSAGTALAKGRQSLRVRRGYIQLGLDPSRPPFARTPSDPKP